MGFRGSSVRSPAQQTERLLEVLADSGLSFVVIGGVAAIAHGATTATQDLDIALQLDPEEVRKLLEALAPYSPVHFTRPDLPLTMENAESLAGFRLLLVQTDLGRLDVLSEVAPFERVADLPTVQLPLLPRKTVRRRRPRCLDRDQGARRPRKRQDTRAGASRREGAARESPRGRLSGFVRRRKSIAFRLGSRWARREITSPHEGPVVVSTVGQARRFSFQRSIGRAVPEFFVNAGGAPSHPAMSRVRPRSRCRRSGRLGGVAPSRPRTAFPMSYYGDGGGSGTKSSTRSSQSGPRVRKSAVHSLSTTPSTV